MATKRTKKAPTRKRTTNGRAKPAPAPAPALTVDKFEVGDQVSISDEDVATLKQTEARIAQAQAQLGTLSEDFERRKAECIQNIVNARSEYGTVIMTIARKYELPVDPGSEQEWKFLPNTNAYERVR